MKLLIIRHGDPDYEKDSLTERGWREAEALADRMEKTEVAAFYVSPLGRARDTASCTLRRLGREAETLDWLREFSPRRWDPDVGRERVIWDWRPDQWTAVPEYYDESAWLHAPEMEKAGVPAEYAWVCRGLDALLARHGYRRNGRVYDALRPSRDAVALFCHFGVECVLLGHLLGLSPMVLWHGTCALTTSVTTLVTEERRQGVAAFRMNGFGDVSHLYAAGMEPSFAARFCETWDSPDERHD
ncbi:MAG: histidine phosphatase family protein [Oscillospiraceae bacterium]|nr:histidine phosphatase family protein [Oscillospiraceae bacterium]